MHFCSAADLDIKKRTNVFHVWTIRVRCVAWCLFGWWLIMQFCYDSDSTLHIWAQVHVSMCQHDVLHVSLFPLTWISETGNILLLVCDPYVFCNSSYSILNSTGTFGAIHFCYILWPNQKKLSPEVHPSVFLCATSIWPIYSSNSFAIYRQMVWSAACTLLIPILLDDTMFYHLSTPGLVQRSLVNKFTNIVNLVLQKS